MPAARHVRTLLTALVLGAAAGCASPSGDVSTSPAGAASPTDRTGLSSASAVDTGSTPMSSVSPTPVATAPPTPSAPTPSATMSATPTPPEPSPAPPGSFVLGDSISLSIAPALSRLGYDITGRVGQSASVEYLRTHLASPAAQEAPAWVIMLGTNNRGDESDLAELRSWIREIRTAREGRPRPHVYWVTPHRPPEYRGGMSTHTLDALTDALRAEAARRPWLTVLDFDVIAREHPEWFAQDGARLHPDADGQAALVDLIAGPGAPQAESAGSIVEIARPTPPPSPPEPADEPEFPAEEFTNG